MAQERFSNLPLCTWKMHDDSEPCGATEEHHKRNWVHPVHVFQVKDPEPERKEPKISYDFETPFSFENGYLVEASGKRLFLMAHALEEGFYSDELETIGKTFASALNKGWGK